MKHLILYHLFIFSDNKFEHFDSNLYFLYWCFLSKEVKTWFSK